MDTKRPKNEREGKIYDLFSTDNWEILHKGFPDFLLFKEKENKLKFIEVKRKQKKQTAKMGLSAHQRRIKEILSRFFEYEVIYI